MTDFKLHCFYNSGNAFKVAMMLDLAGCDWQTVQVTPGGDAVHDPAWWARANGFGEVPVLEQDGRFHSQSGLILHHLARETGRFGPRDADQEAEIWRWILFDNHKFTSNFSMLRFQCAIARTGETDITAYLRARVRSTWGLVDRHLSDRAFLLGDAPTIADLSLAGYQFYGEDTGIDRAAEFPAIEAWTHRIAALPGWRPPQDVLPGR